MQPLSECNLLQESKNRSVPPWNPSVPAVARLLLPLQPKLHNHKHQSFIIFLELRNTCADKHAAPWHVVMSNQLAVTLMQAHFCPSNCKNKQAAGGCEVTARGWKVKCRFYLMRNESLKESDHLMQRVWINKRRLAEAAYHPTDPGHSLKPGGDDTERANTIQCFRERERLVLRPHTNSYSCFLFFFYSG